MEKHSLVFLRDTSENNSIGKSHKINLLKGEPLRFSLQTVDKALLLQGFAIVGAAFLI